MIPVFADIDLDTFNLDPHAVEGHFNRMGRTILNDAGEVLPPFEPGLIYCRQEAYPDFTYINRPEDRQAIDRDGLIGRATSASWMSPVCGSVASSRRGA